jgi:hypothetical protein
MPRQGSASQDIFSARVKSPRHGGLLSNLNLLNVLDPSIHLADFDRKSAQDLTWTKFWYGTTCLTSRTSNRLSVERMNRHVKQAPRRTSVPRHNFPTHAKKKKKGVTHALCDMLIFHTMSWSELYFTPRMSKSSQHLTLNSHLI